MRGLITGGAGFIGSHLCQELLARGQEVTVLDDLSTGSMANISRLKNNTHFHYVIDSVMNRPLLAELVDDSDVVFHLAAAVGVRLIVESPVRPCTPMFVPPNSCSTPPPRRRKKSAMARNSSSALEQA
ncbi:MAG TPA: NAD-dependent epimerase/dehydratase family protein [Terriglobales bacterium]|nr:NAD-dependent epimerase/dehydratase family protein [Terriglobales bacterium]